MSGIQKVYAFLDKVQTYYLATVDGDQARVRPFGTLWVERFEPFSLSLALFG